MSDDEIIAIRKATRTSDVTTPYADSIAFARAVMAHPKPQPVCVRTCVLLRDCAIDGHCLLDGS